VAKKVNQSGTENLDIWKPFGPGPVLSSEDPREYKLMRWRLTRTLRLGDDFIEIMLALTVINLTWEKLRYSRLKKGLIELAHHKRLQHEAQNIERAALLHHRVRAEKAQKEGKRAPKPEDVSDQVKALWDRPATLIEHAQAMRDCLNEYERLDKLEIAVDMRLRAALDDFQRYREGLGRQLREAVGQVIDGEVNELAASANAAVSPKEIPVALVERAPEASNPGASAVVEASDPLAVVVPADEVSVVPAGVSAEPMAEKLGVGRSASDISDIMVPDVVKLTAADLEPNTVSMTPAIINAHGSMVSTAAAPGAVEVPLPDADAQVQRNSSGTP
jgi:hypothetical protein